MTRLGQSPRNGIVRVRPAGKEQPGRVTTGQLSVPAHIRRALPADAWFQAELNEDGILYRFIGCGPDTSPSVEPLPAWAKENGADV